MTRPAQTVLTAAVLLLAVYVYGECRARQGAADERTAQHFRSVDSSATVTDTLFADSLRIWKARAEALGRRPPVVLPPDTVWRQAPRDTLIGYVVALKAENDSLRATVTLWQAIAHATDSLRVRAVGEREQYRTLALSYQKRAQRRLACVGGPSVTAGLDGRIAYGLGASCGIRF